MKIKYLIGALLLTACSVGKKDSSSNMSSDKNYSTIDLSYLDKTIKPQDDFFLFSNGTWVKNNPVPESESRWGSFNELDQANKKKLTEILEMAQKDMTVKGSNNYYLGNYYTAQMNTEARNNLGLSPIEEDLGKINKIQKKSELPNVIGEMHKIGISSMFGFGVGQDLEDVNKNVVYFSQGGLGLPNKDYYTDNNKEDIRNAYEKYITELFMMFGESDQKAIEKAHSVLDFETKMASAMMAPAELRIPENTYNKYDYKNFREIIKTFDFKEYQRFTGAPDFNLVIVGQPDYAKKVEELYKDASLDQWKNYLTFKVMNHFGSHLNEDLEKLKFRFYGTTLKGTKVMKPKNERAIDELTNLEIGEVLGKAFIEKYYSENAKNRVNTMVDNLLKVFDERISNLEWMSAETKTQAKLKLNSIGRKLGYPDKWTDFSSVYFQPRSYVENYKMAKMDEVARNLRKLGQPVDRQQWEMPAHMVNAYYHPLLNEIAFPAGIMQPPFFDENAEDAVNYGRIGMVIGHEFTHGFDDMGSKFAADGTFRNWWTENDRKLFEERTGILGDTYKGFCPIEGNCVNSDLTMGENIADLGGLTLSYYAYTLTDEFKSKKMVAGYTPAQRFFISYAQLWKINYTDEELKNRIANDSHSPGMFRVNGPLMNCPEFFAAFDVKVSDPMRNENVKVARIW